MEGLGKPCGRPKEKVAQHPRYPQLSSSSALSLGVDDSSGRGFALGKFNLFWGGLVGLQVDDAGSGCRVL